MTCWCMAKVMDHDFGACLSDENKCIGTARGEAKGINFVWARTPPGTPFWTLPGPFLDPFLVGTPLPRCFLDPNPVGDVQHGSLALQVLLGEHLTQRACGAEI